MKTYIYLTLKYWRKHKKNAVSLLFAGVLLTAVVFVTLMLARERTVKRAHTNFDLYGHYDLLVANSDDDIYSKLTAHKKGYNYCVINVYGKTGSSDKKYYYGTIEDEHDVWHIPLEEGRMPKNDTEIAASAKVLNALYWVGKCGDTIELDGKTYTVVGIIGKDYNQRRGIENDLSEVKIEGIDPISLKSCKIPSIFIGACDKEPLYRMDMFNNFMDMPDRIFSDEADDEVFGNIWAEIDEGPGWICTDSGDLRIASNFKFNNIETSFFLVIAWIGAVIAALSVYSILRNVFADRRERIETLKKIGMSKRSVGVMYTVECSAFTLIQTVLGLAIGLGVYGGILQFKTSVLHEKPYSGFTNLKIVLDLTPDPFLFACVISAVIMIAAYLISALTSKHKEKTPKKDRKPRSFFRCFGGIFRQKGVTVVQTVALTLIYFSVIMGYMFYTDNGKEHLKDTAFSSYCPPLDHNYYVNSFDMETEKIAEYYYSLSPGVITLGDKNNDPNKCFPFAEAGYAAGIDDTIADKLPDHTKITGDITNTFIVSDEPKAYINEINMSNEDVRRIFLNYSDEKFRNFFEEGQLGSKNMYRIDIKLTTADSIEELSEYVLEGNIDIDAINRGEEILVTYMGGMIPQFEIGETVALYSATAADNDYGLGDISSGEVKIGAILKIPPSAGALKYYTARNDQNYNFLTTATGAEKIGLPYARYTEIYASEPIDGGFIPSSAKMTLMSLEKMKWENLKNKIIKISGMLMIMVLMVLIGFAAYFNGIGMKIRMRSYEISALRAVGTPLSTLRKRILLGSIKIPVIAALASYGMVKSVQFFMASVENYINAFEFAKNEAGGIPNNIDYENDLVNFWHSRLFLSKGMWAVNAEIPTLILLAVICAVTFVLTALALRKFKRDIAFDLNSGRTKQ